MTRKYLFKKLFPEANLSFMDCLGDECNEVNGCDKCTIKDYWNHPATLTKTNVKDILNCLYGKETMYYDTDIIYPVYSARGTGKTYAQELHLIQDGWTKFPSLQNNIKWSMLKDIIDDALDNGFEVTILNGTIYYREKQ